MRQDAETVSFAGTRTHPSIALNLDQSQPGPTQESLRGAIAAVPVETFAGFRPARGRGGFKAEFDHLLDRMPDQILTDELF